MPPRRGLAGVWRAGYKDAAPNGAWITETQSLKHELTPVDKTLKELGFPPAHYVENRYSVVDLFPASRRCGVYVLQFSGNEAYAGQAVEVTKRFLQHRKVFTDIRGISFKSVARKELNQLEKEAIQALEHNGAKIRNIALTSFPPVESDFDELMSHATQDKWLTELTYSDSEGLRAVNSGLREKYTRKFERFLKKPGANEACDFLKLYVQSSIPAFVRSEISYWALSCLPSYSEPATVVWNRVNINWQEVLTVFDNDGKLFVSVHCAATPLQNSFGQGFCDLTNQYPTVQITEHRYEPGGQDQINLVVESLIEAKKLIQDARVLKAVRSFNLKLMRKGGCAYGRYHCLDLADKLISK